MYVELILLSSFLPLMPPPSLNSCSCAFMSYTGFTDLSSLEPQKGESVGCL